jgi:putative holliday junction resolvase
MSAPAWLYDPAAFVQAVGAQGPLLGLDPGTRTIGVAISDFRWTLASPFTTIRRAKLAGDAAQLKALIDAERIVGLVIGMPYNMDGSSGPRAQSVRAFRRALGDHIDLPMLFWDERLSSEAAEQTLKDAGRSAVERQARIDAAAAAHILLDALPTLAGLIIR